MWSGLPRCADPSRLYLPRSLGGLEMPSLPTVYLVYLVSCLVTEADTQAHLHHAQSLLREKDLMQQENKADDQWTVATTKLPENILLLA